MTCSQQRVKREERSTDRWKVFSAKSSLIVSGKYPILIPSTSLSPVLTLSAALNFPPLIVASIHHPSILSHIFDQRRPADSIPSDFSPYLSHLDLHIYCVCVLQYLCVGLVVLAVVGGGISAVWCCGCSCCTVGEGAGVLGSDGSHRGAVHPRTRLSSLGFTPQ